MAVPSCLFVRNRLDLTNALDITPAYLRNTYSDTGKVIDYRNWQISLGRRFRALKIWFVMRSYGLQGMRAHIRKTIELGNLFADLVRSRPDMFEILTKPAFGLTVLRIKSPKASQSAPSSGIQPDAASDALTKSVSGLINQRGEIFITPTVIAGVSAIRVVSGNAQVEEPYMRRAFDILVKTTEEILGENK